MQENLEIERRFFIDEQAPKSWHKCLSKSKIMQFYIDFSQIHLADRMIYYGSIELAHADEKSRLISTSENWTARIRYKDETTILTLKGKRRKSTAMELEWLIERAKGEEIYVLDDFPFVEKTRYEWQGEDEILWEIDEFEGELAGLVIAEVELPSEDYTVQIPSWIGREITGEGFWSNASLARTLKNQRN